uniref:Uncharacterized protein n=1 Tax=Kalanchoe fedtschenkoi TaxID=63787 RepID=A0A7N0RFC0_KALFE
MESKKRAATLSLLLVFFLLIASHTEAETPQLCGRDDPICHNNRRRSGAMREDAGSYIIGWLIAAIGMTAL